MNNISITFLSPLEKIYHNDKIPSNDFTQFSMLRNEKKSFQVAIVCKKDVEAEIIIDTTIDYTIYSVEDIKSDLPMFKGADDYYRYSDDGYYPDLLVPVENKISLKQGNNIFWVELKSQNKNVGSHNINICLKDGSENTLTKLPLS
jgi:hypothetical protein